MKPDPVFGLGGDKQGDDFLPVRVAADRGGVVGEGERCHGQAGSHGGGIAVNRVGYRGFRFNPAAQAVEFSHF